MAAPQPLVDLVNSLHLDGIPGQAMPGDRISPRLLPDLAPISNFIPNPLLNAFATSDTLAQINADLAPILRYISQTLGTDTAAILKAVEFNKPVEASPGALNLASPVVRDLPHLVPNVGVGNPLTLSTYVEGLIGRAKGKLVFTPAEFPSAVTALITKPAILEEIPTVTVVFRVTDAAGIPLVAGRDFFSALPTPFTPEFVLMPAVFDPASGPPSSVRINFFCDVAVNFKPIGAVADTLSRTIGPIPLNLATTLIPLFAVLTEHAIGDSRFPGRVLVGVPDSSTLTSASAAFSSLAQIQSALTNIVTVLGLLGIGVPGSITASIGGINTVIGVPSVGRFRKGDLIAFFEWVWGIPPWDDWQGIFSAVFVFGPPMRRIAPGCPLPIAIFTLSPGSLGVGVIPSLVPFPLAPSVGTATQILPTPPTAPAGGNFNDLLTSLNFPFP